MIKCFVYLYIIHSWSLKTKGIWDCHVTWHFWFQILSFLYSYLSYSDSSDLLQYNTRLAPVLGTNAERIAIFEAPPVCIDQTAWSFSWLMTRSSRNGQQNYKNSTLPLHKIFLLCQIKCLNLKLKKFQPNNFSIF